MGTIGWIACVSGGLLALGVLLAIVLRPIRASLWETRLARARRQFHMEREWLEARFVDRAGASGKPRGLVWADCEFEDDVVYARQKRGGELYAFVGVTISFEAVEGGGMEHVEAVGNLRAASAVFRFVKGKWTTDGRTIFNLNPTEAVAHFENEVELVGKGY